MLNKYVLTVSFLIALFSLNYFLLANLQSDETASHAEPAMPLPDEVEELANYMNSLQRHSHKLFLSVKAKNQSLSAFYVHEIEEVLEEIKKKVPEHDGIFIPEKISSYMSGAIQNLEKNIEKGNWHAANSGYIQLIDGCNNCHHSTDHPFIKIDSAPKGNPFNQIFK